MIFRLANGTYPFDAPLQLNRDAQAYVSLVLALQQLRPDEIDFQYGPGFQAIQPAEITTLNALQVAATQLLDEVARRDGKGLTAAQAKRQQRLIGKLRHLSRLARVIEMPRRLSIGDEAALLYDLALPDKESLSADHVIRTKLYRYIKSPLDNRTYVQKYLDGFVIRYKYRETFFRNAIDVCKTLSPSNSTHSSNEDEIEVIFSSRVPVAHHRYLGNGKSIVTVNMAALSHPLEIVSIACHETYAGHHSQFIALEGTNPALEDRIFLKREKAYLERERMAADYRFAYRNFSHFAQLADRYFESRHSPTELKRYLCVAALISRLNQQSIRTAIDYHDGKIDRQTAENIMKNQYLVSNASGIIDMIGQTGSGIIGYLETDTAVSSADHIAWDRDMQDCDALLTDARKSH